MENLQRLASKNLRFCLQTFNNCLTSSINRNLVTLTTTRQPKDLVEIANSTTSKQSTTNITQRRQFTLSTQFLSNIFNIQDDKDFKERVLNSNKPVVVDFHATWCQPCKILAPRLEQILATYEGKADFAKVDIDKHTDLAFDYNVSSVPTVIAFKNGKAVKQFIGVQDDDRIKKFVKDLVEN